MPNLALETANLAARMANLALKMADRAAKMASQGRPGSGLERPGNGPGRPKLPKFDFSTIFAKFQSQNRTEIGRESFKTHFETKLNKKNDDEKQQ